MKYALSGLEPALFATLFAMNDDELASVGAQRVVADADRGFACRIRLADAGLGESLILINHLSHDVRGLFRTPYAIYVAERAVAPARYVDALPEGLTTRPLSSRAFDRDRMIVTATLTIAGMGDAAIRLLFANARVAYIMAHFAAYGCFAARVERHGEEA